MVSDEKTIYISLRSGQIIYLPIADLDEDKKEILQKRNMKQPVSYLLLSRDLSFLVGYVDIDNVEVFSVYNLIKKQKIWSAKLDLSPGLGREDPK